MAISQDAKNLYFCALAGVALWLVAGVITICLIPTRQVNAVIDSISNPWDGSATLRTSWVEDYQSYFFSTWGFGFNWMLLTAFFGFSVLCRICESKSLVWGSSASIGAKLMLAYSAVLEIIKMIVLIWCLSWLWSYGSEANYKIAADAMDSGFKYRGDFMIYAALTDNNESHAYLAVAVILGVVCLALEFCGIYNIFLGPDSILKDMNSVKAAYRTLQEVPENEDQGEMVYTTTPLMNEEKDQQAAFVRV